MLGRTITVSLCMFFFFFFFCCENWEDRDSSKKLDCSYSRNQINTDPRLGARRPISRPHENPLLSRAAGTRLNMRIRARSAACAVLYAPCQFAQPAADPRPRPRDRRESPAAATSVGCVPPIQVLSVSTPAAGTSRGMRLPGENDAAGEDDECSDTLTWAGSTASSARFPARRRSAWTLRASGDECPPSTADDGDPDMRWPCAAET
jgi:hypothetical protein